MTRLLYFTKLYACQYKMWRIILKMYIALSFTTNIAFAEPIDSVEPLDIEVSNEAIYIDYSSNEEEAGPSYGEKMDPLKKFNIAAFYFNGILDFFTLKLAAQAYNKLTGQFIKSSVGNMVDNYKTPISSLNSALQGKMQDSITHFWRFAINSTLGVFGASDIASKLGLYKPRHRNFGSTLARYGVPPGFYLVLPLFGPTTARDVLDILLLNSKTNYINYELPITAKIGINSMAMIHGRYIILKATSNISRIPDIYTFVRDLYLGNRESEVEYPSWYKYRKAGY